VFRNLPVGGGRRLAECTTDESSNGSTKAKSATFNADPAKHYSVCLHPASQPNTVIACGDLTANRASGKSKPHPPRP
jgi:hypothetical protein